MAYTYYLVQVHMHYSYIQNSQTFYEKLSELLTATYIEYYHVYPSPLF